MRRSSIGICFAVGLLTACSSASSTTASSPITSAAQPASSAAASADIATAASGSAAPASTAPSAYAASGTATDSQGDKATVTISLATPAALTSLNQADMSVCNGMNNLGADADQTIAIPVAITVTLTSSIATSVAVGMDGTHQVTSGGNVQPNGNLPYLAAMSSDDAQCDSTGVTWNSLASGQSDTWNGWLIDPAAITPNDPTGSSADTTIFLKPVVDLGMNNGDWVPDLAASRNLVACTAGVPEGAVIAVDPKVALGSGCTTYTGG